MRNAYISICRRLKKLCHNDTQNTFKLTRTMQTPTACRSIMGTPSQHLRRETKPIKMRLYILQWLFQPDGTSKVENTSEFQIPIISSETGDSTNVPYLHPNQPVSYLGHTFQPDVNQSAPFKIVITKTKGFDRRIVSTNMSRQLITMANNSIINPIIKYSLTLTCFNDQQIDTIHKSMHPTVIADMGYSSKWPKALRYGTHKYCSLKIQHF